MARRGWSGAANLVPDFLSPPDLRGFTPPSTPQASLVANNRLQGLLPVGGAGFEAYTARYLREAGHTVTRGEHGDAQIVDGKYWNGCQADLFEPLDRALLHALQCDFRVAQQTHGRKNPGTTMRRGPLIARPSTQVIKRTLR
jgi:hypothetical protein